MTICGLYNVTATSASDEATAASDTSVNATDDVTPTAAVLSQETKQNQASDPGSRLHGSLAPGVSPEVPQITTAVAPTDAAASTPKAVVQPSFVAPTVTDVQTLNVEADPIVSFSGAALVVTDGTVPAIDTVTAVINKVSPSTQAVSLTTEAVTRANDVLTPADDMIASAMDAAAPTTISASLATDEVAQTTNEMSGTIIPATGGIDPVAKIVHLSTDTILLTLDDVVQGFGAVSTTKAMASAKYTPSPALPTVPPKGLPVIPALESAETVTPDASLLKPPSPDSLNLDVLAPEPNAPKAPAPEASEPDVSPTKVSAPEVSPPEASVPEPPLPETPTLESTPPEVAANEGPPQIPASKSNSLDPAPSSKALSPDAPSLEASDPESPPLDAVGPKAPPTTKVVSLPDAVLPIPKAKHGKSDPPLIDEKEKSESAKSTHHGKEKKKLGIFPFLQLHSS